MKAAMKDEMMVVKLAELMELKQVVKMAGMKVLKMVERKEQH